MSQLFEALHRAFHRPETRLYRWVQGLIWALIFLSVGLLGWELGSTEDPPSWLVTADQAVLWIFAVELALRVLSFRPAAMQLFELGLVAKVHYHLVGRLRFLLRPMSLVDLATVISLVPALRGLRVIRLLRLLRPLTVFRHVHPLESLFHAIRQNGLLFVFALSLLGLAALVGGSSFYLAERGANANVHGLADALWWALVTLTTVGFGDIAPVTGAGRIIGSVLMICGLFTLAIFAGIIGQTLLSAVLAIREEQFQMSNYVNHVVVFGHDGKDLELLGAIRAEAGFKQTDVLVFSPAERPKSAPPEIVWVQGNPTREEELDKTAVHQARAALIVASRDMPPQQADAVTILTAFTLRSYLKKLDQRESRVSPLHVVAEILEPENVQHAHTAGADEVIETYRLGFSLLAHSTAVPGAGPMISQLTSTGGQSLFLGAIPDSWVEPGASFGLVAQRLRKETGAQAIGIRPGGGGSDMVNPPDDRPMARDDGLFYLAPAQHLSPWEDSPAHRR